MNNNELEIELLSCYSDVSNELKIELLACYSEELNNAIKMLVIYGHDPLFRITFNVDELVDEILRFEELEQIGVQILNTELGKFLSSIKSEKMYTVNQFISISKTFRNKPYSVQHVHKILKNDKSSLFYNQYIKNEYGIVIPEELVKKYCIITYIDSKLIGLYKYDDVLEIVFSETGKKHSMQYVSRHFDSSENRKYVKLGTGSKISNVTYLTKKDVNLFLKHKEINKIL